MKDLSLGSVSIWLDGLKAGDEQAAQQLWNRYFHRLTLLARSRLQNVTRVVDEEDVALYVLQSLFDTAKRGGYPKLTKRTELWPLLVSITIRKATNELNWQYAQKRTPQAEDRYAELANIASKDLDPGVTAQIADQLQQLLDVLGDPTLVHIARQRLKGHTVIEIAEELRLSRRTVARKLDRIRQEWEVSDR